MYNVIIYINCLYVDRMVLGHQCRFFSLGKEKVLLLLHWIVMVFAVFIMIRLDVLCKCYELSVFKKNV